MSQLVDLHESTMEYCCFVDNVRNATLTLDELKKKFWSLFEDDPVFFRYVIGIYYGCDNHSDDESMTKNWSTRNQANNEYVEHLNASVKTECLEVDGELFPFKAWTREEVQHANTRHTTN